MLTIVVPTFNEKGNIEPLVKGVFAVTGRAGIEADMIVVDDHSPDGTADEVRRMGKDYPVRCVEKEKEGLSAAVLVGIAEATDDYVLVMDGDLSHPAESIPDMLKALETDGYDIAIGSRYVPGGGVVGWPVKRLFASKAGGILARGIVSVKDPTAGFFAFRRNLTEGVELRPVGYKICLEIIVKTATEKITEIPIVFRDREWGSSKLGMGVTLDYFHHLLLLYLWALFNPNAAPSPVRTFAKFAAVGFSGVVINYGIFRFLTGSYNMQYLAAAAIAIEISLLCNFLFNNFWTWRHRPMKGLRDFALRCLKYHVIAGLSGFAGNWGLLYVLVSMGGMQKDIAYFIGIAAGMLINFVLNNKWTFAKQVWRST